MSSRRRYVLGGDVGADEDVRDTRGRLVDDEYARRAAEDALGQVRGRGRPSLSDSGESPLLRVRLPHELDEAVSEAARRAGTSRSEWVRRALSAAVHKAS